MSLADWHWLRPEWLWALLPLAALWYRAWRRRGNDWGEVIDPALQAQVLTAANGGRRHLPWLLLGAAWLLAVLALAGPSWERTMQIPQQRQDALVIVLDLSLSMFARDVAPSRLERARLRIRDVLEQRREGLTALVVYSGDAHVVTPLSDDTATLTHQLAALSPEIMPVYGSDPLAGIEQALELLQQHGLQRGRILLVSDGLHPQQVDGVAQLLHGRPVALAILGVGTTAAAPIHLGDQLLRHADGRVAASPLGRDALQALARRSGGRYAEASADGGELHALLAGVADTGTRDSGLRVETWRDHTPRLALCLLPLAALAFRRGWMLTLLLALPLLQLPVNAQADPAADAPHQMPAVAASRWWHNVDQRAMQRLAQGDAAAAAALFRDPHWRGIALYRAGDYAAAARAFAAVDTARAHYNRGNALARAGELAAALQAYERSLAMRPDDADTRFNHTLVQRQLRQQTQTPEQQSPTQQNKAPAPRPRKTEPHATAQAQRHPEGSAAPARTPDATPSATSHGDAEAAREQWLRQIPDDPGGLLRRKFQALGEQREREGRRVREEQPPW